MSAGENVFLTKVAINPSVHNIFFFAFPVYTYLLTLVFIIIYRQFCQKSQFKKKMYFIIKHGKCFSILKPFFTKEKH